MIMYDFPMHTKEDVRIYTRFRKQLLKIGYYQMQASVYIKNVNNTERVSTIERQIRLLAPSSAHIRMLTLTESQFQKMKMISGEESLSERIVMKRTPMFESSNCG